MRDQEEAFLRKQMNPKKAKEIAEQKYRVIIIFLIVSSFYSNNSGDMNN